MFEKGHKKLGGRKKGTKNKSNLMAKFEECNFDVIAAIIESIAAQPEYMRADTLIKLLEFMYPKKKAMDVSLLSPQDVVPLVKGWLQDGTTLEQ
jgi:hypothetical protein